MDFKKANQKVQAMYAINFWFFFYQLRFRDTSANPEAASKRYVITNPPDDFSILSSDQVIIINFYSSI
jgi:hypothetical protein